MTHGFRSHIIKNVVDIVSQVLEIIEPLFDSFIFYFLVRSIMKHSLDLGQFFPQIFQLGVNSLRANILLEGFISKLLKYDFDQSRSSSVSHC
ncbi:hypothetical protein Hanom_Chr04g00281491 [Helianthus anomalus]